MGTGAVVVMLPAKRSTAIAARPRVPRSRRIVREVGPRVGLLPSIRDPGSVRPLRPGSSHRRRISDGAAGPTASARVPVSRIARSGGSRLAPIRRRRGQHRRPASRARDGRRHERGAGSRVPQARRRLRPARDPPERDPRPRGGRVRRGARLRRAPRARTPARAARRDPLHRQGQLPRARPAGRGGIPRLRPPDRAARRIRRRTAARGRGRAARAHEHAADGERGHAARGLRAGREPLQPGLPGGRLRLGIVERVGGVDRRQPGGLRARRGDLVVGAGAGLEQRARRVHPPPAA